MRIFCLLLGILILSMGLNAQAEQVSYVIVIGNNAPPEGDDAGLPVLRFADDDAVRYYNFFKEFANDIELLTVLDSETQKRYPAISSAAKPPTNANFKRAVEQFQKKIRTEAARGNETSFYFVFSGHGATADDGTPFLSLLDGQITQDVLYEDVIGQVQAEYHHVLVDACRAEAVVGVRGMFDKEVESVQTSVSSAEVQEVLGRIDPQQFPGLGVLIATTRDQEAHEWSRIQSGVFTHELLSGLKGAADVNHDGQIEYSEVQAFIASANRNIKDPRALPNVIARPPVRNRRVPLVSLSTMRTLRNVSVLSGDPSRLGHFYIELENGERYLDANLADLQETAIVLPRGEVAFLRTSTQEALIRSTVRTSNLSDLNFVPLSTRSRGSIDHSYRKALFASPYGADYYKGFVDSTGAVPVVFFTPGREHSSPKMSFDDYRKPLAISSAVLSGASFAAFVVTGSLALDARQDAIDTDLQKKAHEANDRYKNLGYTAIATGAFALTAGIVCWLLWPKDREKKGKVRVAFGDGLGGGAGSSLSVIW